MDQSPMYFGEIVKEYKIMVFIVYNFSLDMKSRIYYRQH